MGLGSWLKRKMDEKQRKKAEERKYYEQIKREERTRELERIQARGDVLEADRRRREFRQGPLGLRKSDDFWEQVGGTRIYGTKKKKK